MPGRDSYPPVTDRNDPARAGQVIFFPSCLFFFLRFRTKSGMTTPVSHSRKRSDSGINTDSVQPACRTGKSGMTPFDRLRIIKTIDLKYFALRKCMSEAPSGRQGGVGNKICLRNEVTSYFISAERIIFSAKDFQS